MVCGLPFVPIEFPGFDRDDKREPAEGLPLRCGPSRSATSQPELLSWLVKRLWTSILSPPETVSCATSWCGSTGPTGGLQGVTRQLSCLQYLLLLSSTPSIRMVAQLYLCPAPGDPNPWPPQAPDTHGPCMWYTYMLRYMKTTHT